MRMSNNIVRPITTTNGFLVFKFHPHFCHTFVSYRLKHLAIFTKVEQLVIREEWFRSEV